MTKQGLHFDVVQGIDVAEFNYAPYAQQLKDKGVKVVFWAGSYQHSLRLAQAMQQIGYKPDLYLRDPTDYIPDFVETGGDAVDGTVVFLNFVPFEEAEQQQGDAALPELAPAGQPRRDADVLRGLLLVRGQALRREVDRARRQAQPAALVDALRKTDNWTANGMTAPQHVGSKRTGDCWRFIQLSGGSWKPVGGTKYTCAGTTPG